MFNLHFSFVLRKRMGGPWHFLPAIADGVDSRGGLRLLSGGEAEHPQPKFQLPGYVLCLPSADRTETRQAAAIRQIRAKII